MTFDQLLKIYGTQANVARAFGVARASVNRWAKTNKVPQLRALQLELQGSTGTRNTRKQLQIEAARRWAQGAATRGQEP